jgi:hypothetical protein
LGWIGDLFQDITSGDYLFVVAFVLLLSYAAWRVFYRVFRPGVDRRYARFFGLSLQIGLTLMLERLYEFSRAHVAVAELTTLAYTNGYSLAQFEITHGFFFEPTLEHFFAPDVWLMHGIYFFYAFAHLFVTLGFLIWLYLRRNSAFMFVRNLFYLTTGVALVIYLTYPTSPPRFFYNLGFFNPEVVLGIAPAGGAEATAQTFNPFAAMPSLHMVYALIVGATLVVVGRRLAIRVAGFVYPFVMMAVVLISANHWILDVVGAVIVVMGSAAVLAAAGRLTTAIKKMVGGVSPPERRSLAA